jgi:hypothetical protein
MIANVYYACRRDWYRLPNRLRNAIWNTADQPFGQARAQAVTDCLDYWGAHPRTM